MSNAIPFLIANLRTGLERDVEPWLLPEDAFPDIEDAYMFRGRIPRRKGFRTLGRLITTVGAVDTLNLLPVMGLLTREITTINEEQLIAFDTTKANVYSNFLSAFVDITFYKTTAIAFSWTGSNSDFFWSWNYLNAFWVTNGTVGFQPSATTTAGTGDGLRWYDGTGWVNFMPAIFGATAAPGTTYLMGSRLIFSYRNRLVVLNTFEGTSGVAFTQFRQRARWSQNGTPFPALDATGAASPLPTGITGLGDSDAWRTDIVGKGGFIDAPTQEEIITAQFYKDTLIVYFERSTWQLRYTGNELLPFIWERINVELGVESTFSMVPFDSGIIGIGNYGIMTCDSTGVKRIDQIIPDEVFNIHNGNDGVKRIYGIRDYSQQLVYWTFPDEDTNPTFPTKVLVYNYLDGSYSINNDSFTCFGYWQSFADATWADLVQEWGSTPIAWNSGQFQSEYPKIVAGNQQGFVFQNYNNGRIDNDFSLFLTGVTNAAAATVTSPNHNLKGGTVITFTQIVGMSKTTVAENTGPAPIGSTSFTSNLIFVPIQPSSVTITIGANVFTDDGLGNLLNAALVVSGTINYSSGVFSVAFTSLAANTNALAAYISSLNNSIFRVSESNLTTNTFEIQTLDQNGNFINVDSTTFSAYVSGGLIKIRNNFLIKSKRFNPFIKEGDQLRIQNIDYFLEASQDLNFTTTIYLDENPNSFVEQDVVVPSSALLGKVWFKAFYSAIGQFVQIEMRFSDEQMFNPVLSDGDFTLHAMNFWFSRAGRLTYGTL